MSGLLKRISLGMIFFLIPCLPAKAAEVPGLEALEREIVSNLSKVDEFEVLRQACTRLKIRCWLFGGTAAGYGHYVKWDLAERQQGSARRTRFDYTFPNIYRSTQDADIVINGTAEQAAALEKEMAERFPYLQGRKDLWEVRLLTKARVDKEAILGNPDFLNQHTDSNSTGLIELTTPPPGERAIVDVRDTRAGSVAPQFLKDIQESRIRYYFSELHGTTSRFKRGLNPPILSVIRLLTKAFQYDLELRPEDLQTIRPVIAAFDPKRDLADPYVAKWIEKNGKKLLLNAIDIEKAWNRLDELGLRQKLLATGDRRISDTLAWWMNKEPLRSLPVGTGRRMTAAQLFRKRGWAEANGELIVSHATRDFAAYESITSSLNDLPNVYISRWGTDGESALSGEGFYTALGRNAGGGRQSFGYTIRLKVDPRARLGTDFIVDEVKDEVHLIFRNRNVLQVIPESLQVSPEQYFRMLLSGEFEHADLGMRQKFKRQVMTALGKMSDAELKSLRKAIQSVLKEPHANWRELEEALTMPQIARLPIRDDLIDYAFRQVLNYPNDAHRGFFTNTLLQHIEEPPLAIIEESIKPALNSDAEYFAFRLFENNEALKRRPEYKAWATKLIENNPKSPSAFSLLKNPVWQGDADRDRLMSLVMDRIPGGTTASYSKKYFLKTLGQGDWAHSPSAMKWIEKIAADPFVEWRDFHEMLKTEAWATHPQGVRALELSLTRARRYPGNRRSDPTLGDLLKIPGWRERPELISACGGAPSERCLRQLLSEGKRFAPAIPCLVDGLSRHL